MFKRKRATLAAKRTVTDDWIAALPRAQAEVFEVTVRRWETFHAMMSIALDDAISYRIRGELISARQQAAVSADLFTRLAGVLIGSCNATAAHGRHMDSLPPVRALDEENFRSDTGRSAATRSLILHNVLIGGRLRFSNKLKILTETMNLLVVEFRNAAEEVSEGLTIAPDTTWAALDELQYDFTTCLRETEIMLKCFLRALPAEQVQAYQHDLESTPPLSVPKPKAQPRVRANRASA